MDSKCLTCPHHDPNWKSIDDAPPHCWDCVSFNHKTTSPVVKDSPEKKPLDVQVAGNHYKEFVIQPIEFALVNRLNACQTIALRYLVRKKGDKAKRLEDLDKCIHTIQIYKQMLEEGRIDV